MCVMCDQELSPHGCSLESCSLSGPAVGAAAWHSCTPGLASRLNETLRRCCCQLEPARTVRLLLSAALRSHAAHQAPELPRRMHSLNRVTAQSMRQWSVFIIHHKNGRQLSALSIAWHIRPPPAYRAPVVLEASRGARRALPAARFRARFLPLTAPAMPARAAR
jgi:hypothetical protein